jgi:hypothetical protein
MAGAAQELVNDFAQLIVGKQQPLLLLEAVERNQGSGKSGG